MSQVNRDRHSTSWAGGSANKGTVALVTLPSLNRPVPPASKLICVLLGVPGACRAAAPSLELRARGFVSVSCACVVLLREVPQSQQPLASLGHHLCSFSWPRVMGTLFWHWNPGLGSPPSSGGTPTTEMSLLILNRHTVDVGLAQSTSPPLLPVLRWPLRCVPGYRISVQLDDRQLPTMAALQWLILMWP